MQRKTQLKRFLFIRKSDPSEMSWKVLNDPRAGFAKIKMSILETNSFLPDVY